MQSRMSLLAEEEDSTYSKQRKQNTADTPRRLQRAKDCGDVPFQTWPRLHADGRESSLSVCSARRTSAPPYRDRK